ncbi:enterochelin esterase-like enzyme [Terriglobus roseus DSM 18391]|uniref:Enterochelin esterase-like enzyme n=2 Tax=Terriglobus roseus TaxID=392734 RepID=I3ZDM5_TERRK|nr:enterochelin esterase-like enzyme [Terriglobus roseus DSM 18391]
MSSTSRLFCATFVLSTAIFPSQNRMHAQATASASAAQGQVAATPVVSPEVHPDGTITFRYEAAGAKAVTVTVEGNAKPTPLSQNAGGVWEVSTPAMQPEFYGYTFAVDGKRALDPHNATVRPNLLSPTTVAHVPAQAPKPWDRTDIPHGEVSHVLYRSKLVKVDDGDNGDRDMWIYTPPGYDARRKEKYPVLYLNHGYSDAANGWVEAGQANLIFDSLLHDGKIVPMVVVMPLGYGTMHIVTAGWNRVGSLIWENQVAYSDQLLHEIIPMAEARLNIARDRDHRAIAGLSMGGGHSIYTGLNHPETFAYVGAFSSAVTSPDLRDTRIPGSAPLTPADYDKGFQTIVPKAKTQQPLKLFWESCGTEDGLITVNRAFATWAKTNIKGNVQTRETPGMHTWMVWRDDLIDFTPLLFR